MSQKLGINCKLYKKVSSTWTEVNKIGDLRVTWAWNEYDDSDRSALVDTVLATSLSMGCEFTLKDDPADTATASIISDILAGTVGEYYICNGDPTVSGTRILHVNMLPVGGDNMQNRKEGAAFDVKLKPAHGNISGVLQQTTGAISLS
jgi:hypothetical protein